MLNKIFSNNIYSNSLVLAISIDLIIIFIYWNTFNELYYISILIHHIAFIFSTSLILLLMNFLLKKIIRYQKYRYLLTNIFPEILKLLVLIWGVSLLIYWLFQIKEHNFEKLFLIWIFSWITISSLFLWYFIFYIIPINLKRDYINKNKIIDVNTFKYLWWNYAKDKNNFYYNWVIIFNKIDKLSFKVLWNNYAEDNNFIFYKDYKISWINNDYFKLLQWDYSTDYKSIYYKYNKIKGIDTDSFEYINNIVCKDKNNTFIYGKKFYINNIKFLYWTLDWFIYKHQWSIFFTNDNNKKWKELVYDNIIHIWWNYLKIDNTLYKITALWMGKIINCIWKNIIYISHNILKINWEIYDGYNFTKLTESNVTIINAGQYYIKNKFITHTKSIDLIRPFNFINIEYWFIKSWNNTYYYWNKINKSIDYLWGSYYLKDWIITTKILITDYN
jgi:hypothetical protein